VALLADEPRRLVGAFHRGYSWLDSTKRKARFGVRNPGAYRVLRPLKSIDPAGIQGLYRTDRAPKAASSNYAPEFSGQPKVR
jgi:hypothetical protein